MQIVNVNSVEEMERMKRKYAAEGKRLREYRGFEPIAVTVVSFIHQEVVLNCGRQAGGQKRVSENRAVAKCLKANFISDFILQR